MPKLNRDGHITDPNSPTGAVFIENIRKNSEKLNITFENALDPQDSFDWIGSFKSNLVFSKGTDQNWSTKLAKFYFDQLNRRVDRTDKNFNSLTHDYDKLFVNEDDKFLFLDKISFLIQNLVSKRGDKEKNPILVIENQNPLIQNYIKIAHKNLGSEGLGKESLDSSGSSANDGREINKIIIIARKKIKVLANAILRFIPPESSLGIKFIAWAKPTFSKASITIGVVSLITPNFLVCLRNGNSKFSLTVIESYKALP